MSRRDKELLLYKNLNCSVTAVPYGRTYALSIYTRNAKGDNWRYVGRFVKTDEGSFYIDGFAFDRQNFEDLMALRNHLMDTWKQDVPLTEEMMEEYDAFVLLQKLKNS